jgi:hypothetical protein
MMDLRQPHAWYPFARALQRRVIYHAGGAGSALQRCILQASQLQSPPLQQPNLLARHRRRRSERGSPLRGCVCAPTAHCAPRQQPTTPPAPPPPAGPTNSGKTYNALQALKAAPRGVYCGPLRLLAMEVYEGLNQDGVYCNLLTGQEKQQVGGGRGAGRLGSWVAAAGPRLQGLHAGCRWQGALQAGEPCCCCCCYGGC